jgi:predicted PurR-regulated permease PerM
MAGVNATGTINRGELGRITLSVLFIGGLIVASLWVLRPFLAALVWAAMIVVATWPMLLAVQRLLGGRRSLAVLVMTLALVTIFIVPVASAFTAILANIDQFATLATRFATAELPRAPSWLASLPLVGERLAAAWNELASAGIPDLVARAEPHGRAIVAWITQHAGGAVMLTLHFLLIVILAAVLYAGGEAWADWIRRFGRRLAEEKGERMVVLAGQAIRGVALGVVVTAVVQSLLGGVGLAIAGVPFAAVLTALMFVLCIAQIGPILVLLGATAWAWSDLGAGWGTFLLVWSLVVGLMDNFLRPVLIRRGADLPLLLIFSGVVGGLVAFGIVGIFVGPVVLAVAYTLLDDWVATDRKAVAGNPADNRSEGNQNASIS